MAVDLPEQLVFLSSLNLKTIHVRKIPGVYFLFRKDELVYIGSSESVQSRIFSHLHTEKQFDSAHYIELRNVSIDRIQKIERMLIKYFKPFYNGDQITFPKQVFDGVEAEYFREMIVDLIGDMMSNRADIKHDEQDCGWEMMPGARYGENTDLVFELERVINGHARIIDERDSQIGRLLSENRELRHRIEDVRGQVARKSFR